MADSREVAAVRALIELGRQRGLRIHRQHSMYRPTSGIRRWFGKTDTATVVVERWPVHHKFSTRMWRLEAWADGGHVEIHENLTVERAEKLLAALGIIPDRTLARNAILRAERNEARSRLRPAGGRP